MNYVLPNTEIYRVIIVRSLITCQITCKSEPTLIKLKINFVTSDYIILYLSFGCYPDLKSYILFFRTYTNFFSYF